MKPLAPWSIRTHILLLIALAGLPLLWFLLLTGREQQHAAKAARDQMAACQAFGLASLQERMVADAHQFLAVLAELPQVKRQDAKACNALFAHFLAQNPHFDNLVAATPDGAFYASGRPFFPHDAKDRRYFQEAVRTRRFSSGEFVIARNSYRPALHFALPLLGPSGEVLQILVAGLDLAGLDQGFDRKELPPGATFALLDHEGTVLNCSGGASPRMGATFPLWPLPATPDGLVELATPQGGSRTYASRRLSLPGETTPYMTVLVHLPEAASLAEARRILYRNLLLLAGAILVATAGALAAGSLGIAAPLRHLLKATQTMADGQRHAPLTLTHAPAEFRQLANAFATLSETSALREAQRLQVTESLKQSEERYRAIVANAPIGIFHFSKQGIIQECNEGFASIISTPKEAIPGFNMLRQAGNEPVRLAILEALCGRRGVYEGPYQPVLSGARPAQVRVLTYGICTQDGRFLGGVGLVENIAARQQADQALKESEARYQGLFQNSPDCIFWIRVQEDGQFIVDSVNPAQEAAAGLDAAAMEGKPLSSFFPIASAGKLEAQYQRCRQEGRSITYEHKLDFREGAPSYQTLLVPLPDADGAIRRMVGISRDITQLKVAEEALRQAQKLESLGVLAGGIAHDFNNLLTAILGNLDLSIDRLPPTSEVVPYLENAERTALKASELTKQMLAYSGKGHFLVRPQCLNHLVEEMTHLLKISIPKKVALEYRLGPGLPAIEADSAQIQQVIMNLVTNAAEAIADQEGTITITTRLIMLDAPFIDTALANHKLEAGPYVQLEVADTGCGMTPEVLARIFDPFYTTKHSGHGLGLSAMLGILRGHRAGIQIHSEEGKGSTFRIYFPATGSPLPVQVPSEVTEDPQLQGTVLLVDDEAIILEALAPALEAMGFTVLTARDGVEAVDLYREAHPTIDLVLMDLTMPRMNGREAFQAMRLIQPDARVILTSGYNEKESLQHFIAKDLAGFIQKPFLLKAFRNVIQAALQGRPSQVSG